MNFPAERKGSQQPLKGWPEPHSSYNVADCAADDGELSFQSAMFANLKQLDPRFPPEPVFLRHCLGEERVSHTYSTGMLLACNSRGGRSVG